MAEEFGPTQEVGDNETNQNGALTNGLDDSIGLSKRKLRNSEVQELTFS